MIIKNMFLCAVMFCTSISAVDYTEIKTEIYIIGTVHENTANFNSDTLLNILNKINPDLILTECDTSYLTKDFKFKEEVKDMFPETISASAYLETHNAELRPFDIPGRDEFLDSPERRKNVSLFFTDITRMKEFKKLSPQSDSLFEKIEGMMIIADEMSNAGASYINSTANRNKIDIINYYSYEMLDSLIDITPELKQYKSFWTDECKFWIKRNNTMMKNIYDIKNKLEPEIIVVLCGFAHINLLKKGLSNINQKDNSFELKEYFGN